MARRTRDFNSRHAANMDVPTCLRHHLTGIRLQGRTMRLAIRMAALAGLWLVLGLAAAPVPAAGDARLLAVDMEQLEMDQRLRHPACDERGGQ